MDYKPDNRFTMLAAALVVGGTLFTATQVHAANVIIAPSSSVVTIGDTLTVDVRFNGTDMPSYFGGNTTYLAAFDFNLTYDASVFSYTGYMLGNSLGELTIDADDMSSGGNIAGVVSLAEVSYLTDFTSIQTGTFTLATLSFEALYSGESVFTLDSTSLFGDESANAIQPIIGSASVQVVPVPSAGLLMFTALIGLASLRRGRAN